MTILRVEYEGVRYDLDVLESTPIRLDISAIENSDIGEVFGAASQQFTLPGSKKNNKFFKHAYKVGTEVVPGLGESVKCWVISESDTLLEGSLFLDSVVKTSNGFFNYEVTIVNNVITFNETIKTTRIKDLAWNDYSHSLSMINITASWNDELFGGDIFYPLIDQGRDGQETTGSLPNIAINPADDNTPGYINSTITPIQANQFTPAIRVKTVLDKIFEAGEFRYETSLTDLFNNTYILPKQTETLAVKGSSFSDYGIIVSKGGSPDIVPAGSSYTTIQLDTETYDPTDAFDPLSHTFIVPRTGAYSFSGSVQYSLDPEDTSPIVKLRLRNNTTNSNIGFTYSEPNEIINTIGVETDLVNLTANDEIQLQISYLQGGGAGALDIEVVANGTNLQTLETPINWETGIVEVGEQFDPQVKCIDILKGIIQKFNLVFEPDYTKNRTIKIETYQEWVRLGERKDWTDKIQNAERIFLKSPLSSQPKTIQFQDAKDNDKLSKQVIDNAEGLQWGTSIVDAISDVPQGEKKIGEYFAPVVLERLPGGSATNVIPQLYKTDDTQVERKTFKFKPRIGYKITGSLSQTAYIGGNVTPFTDYATISNYDTIPVVSGSTKNLHWNETFYPPTFGASQTGSITAYDEYWSTYVNDLYRDGNKILKADIYFEPYELNNIALNDLIFVEDSYYRINKISGYNVNNPDVVSVELIGLSSGEIPSVEINCDFDFQWGETTTTTTSIPPVQPTTSTTTTAPPTTTTTSTTSTTTAPTTTTTTTTTIGVFTAVNLSVSMSADYNAFDDGEGFRLYVYPADAGVSDAFIYNYPQYIVDDVFTPMTGNNVYSLSDFTQLTGSLKFQPVTYHPNGNSSLNHITTRYMKIYGDGNLIESRSAAAGYPNFWPASDEFSGSIWTRMLPLEVNVDDYNTIDISYFFAGYQWPESTNTKTIHLTINATGSTSVDSASVLLADQDPPIYSSQYTASLPIGTNITNGTTIITSSIVTSGTTYIDNSSHWKTTLEATSGYNLTGSFISNIKDGPISGLSKATSGVNTGNSLSSGFGGEFDNLNGWNTMSVEWNITGSLT